MVSRTGQIWDRQRRSPSLAKAPDWVFGRSIRGTEASERQSIPVTVRPKLLPSVRRKRREEADGQQPPRPVRVHPVAIAVSVASTINDVIMLA